MTPELENLVDRVTVAALPPGQTTLEERRRLHDALFLLVEAILAQVRAESSPR